jgi:uroporphyrinogen decarboxylase
MKFEEINRKKFKELFYKRRRKVKEKTKLVFSFEELQKPPFLVNSAFYHLFGLSKDIIPDHYYEDPSVMTSFQEKLMYNQLIDIDDDFVPYLVPWFGTGVLPSAFGAQIDFPAKEDPVLNPRHYVIRSNEEIKTLHVIDPEKDGLMPRVLKCLKYMKANSFLPVGITDCQGPLATANRLMGYEKFFYLMFDQPALVHRLMEVITESLIIWIKKQKEVIGEGLDECIGDQQIYTGDNIGIWISDDDAVLLSPKHYREFVVPYNTRILSKFNGGAIHYCGNANHQIDNFLNTGGLKALNVYALHDVKNLVELKKGIENRIVLIACDFTPIDYTEYYRDIIENLSLRGLIIDSQFSFIISLTKDGRYVIHERDASVKRSVFDFLDNSFR